MACTHYLPKRRPLDDYTPIRQKYESRSTAGVLGPYDWTGYTATIKVTLASDGSTVFTDTVSTTPNTDGYLSHTPTTAQAALLTATDYDVQFTVTSAGAKTWPTPVMRMHVDPNI